MEVLNPLKLNPAMNVTRVSDELGLQKLQDFFNRVQQIGFDVETDPKKDFYWRKARLLQFGNINEQYVIDLLDICNGDSDLLFQCQGFYGMFVDKCPLLVKVLDTIRVVLESDKWVKVGVNLGFEYTTMYWNFGLRSYGFYDCMAVEKVIYAGYHSLKHYEFFSMASMFERYFNYTIDKELQTSFTLEGTLTDAQYTYAALDTRVPFAIKLIQEKIIRGETPSSLAHFDKLLFGDDLREVCQIENDAIGAFQDMHIHGERIDREGWLKWVNETSEKRTEVIAKLDELLIPIVGDKNLNFDKQIYELEVQWKSLRDVPWEEVLLKKAAKKDDGKKKDLEQAVTNRLWLKEYYKKQCSELSKYRTKIKNLKEDCEGQALLNYGSPKQLLEALQQFKGLKNLKDTNDDTLEQYESIPVVGLLQEFRGYDKILSTYGTAWATTWVTRPCSEEGWLHPGDKRIHHVYNQQDAETGRSSSEQPNGQNVPPDPRKFYVVDEPDEFAPEGYVYVTADMSGAELRIIADLADDPIWIGAFARGEDVHSVGAEILFPEEWPKLALPDCKYFSKKPNGEYARKKCNCPEHKVLRGNNKENNFLLAYGGGPAKLARKIKRAFSFAKELMKNHERKFPNIWAYLEKSGKNSAALRKSFDMFNRRRIFPYPTRERAIEKAKEDYADRLAYPEELQKQNIINFNLKYGRKPNKDELWYLKNREPNASEIINAKKMLYWAVERQGKNHAIQGTNATIAKLAMGAGYDKDGKPFLWHVLPKYHATLKKFVHDELVIMCPKRYGQTIADLVGDAFRRAAAVHMKKVVMEFDYKISTYWEKG